LERSPGGVAQQKGVEGEVERMGCQNKKFWKKGWFGFKGIEREPRRDCWKMRQRLEIPKEDLHKIRGDP